MNQSVQDQNYTRWHDTPAYWKDYVKLLQIEDAPLLDIGCGSGWLAEHVQDYTGIDASPASVKAMQERGYQVVLASADRKLPFPKNRFACVFMKDVLEHLHKPIAAVSEAIRVLKPGGRIIAFVPDSQRWVWDDYTHVRPYSKKSLLQLFSDCGTAIQRVSYEPIMPGIGKLCKLLRLKSRPLPFWWLAKLPFMRRNVYVIANKI